jgi:hypothetical protein
MSAAPASQKDSSRREESESQLGTDALLGAVERYGKASVTLAGALYVSGLIASIWYYSSFHVRSIELLRTQYILTGVWYWIVLLLHVAVPQFILKRSWQRILYMLFGLAVLLSLQSSFSVYLQTLVQRALGSKPYFEFTAAERSDLKGDMLVVVISYLFAPILFWSGYSLYVNASRKWGALFIVWSLWFNLHLFSGYVFPNTPQTLGGGEPAIVEVYFKEGVSAEAKREFDVSRDLTTYDEPFYVARLVHMDEHTIFFKTPRWFQNDIFEFDRDQIQMLRYRSNNPIDFGTPNQYRRQVDHK